MGRTLIADTHGSIPKGPITGEASLRQTAAFANAAAMAGATAYIPAARKGDVLAHTALAGAGETVEITFKAPATAGSYTFLCSFPGHFAAGMRGTLVVK